MSRGSHFTPQCDNCRSAESISVTVTTRAAFTFKAGDWTVAMAERLGWLVKDGRVLCAVCAVRAST